MCGFNDQSYFVKQFKRATGMTCTEYRSIKATERNNK
ncbi:MAG: helix-turn-helix domain-containing protein [Eubacteriales bacterium]